MTGLFAISFWAFIRLAFSGDSLRFQPLIHGKPTFGMDVFIKCYDEATIPMQVALGNFFKVAYMCSDNYYDTCRQQLPVALVNKTGFQPYQIEYIMSTLLSWVDGGGTYLCNKGESSIRELMEKKGGYACIRDFFPEDFQYCSHNLALLKSGYEYSEEYCRMLDGDLQCYIDLACKCENRELEHYFRDFFESIVWKSPCRDYSKFTNSAGSKTAGILLVTLAVIALLCIWK